MLFHVSGPRSLSSCILGCVGLPIALALAPAATGAERGPTGETCEDAILISLGSIDNYTGLRSDDGDSGGCFGLGDDSPDVYFLFFANTPGPHTIETCGGITNFTTVLSVHTGCPTGSNNLIVCDINSCGDGASTVTINALLDTPYYIRVGGLLSDEGDFTLTVIPPPNEPCDCKIAEPIFGNTFFAGSTTGEPTCTGEPCFAGSPAKLYAYTPDTSGLGILDTCSAATNFDTTLSIHSGCPMTPENMLACSDDNCGTRSSLTYCATAGQTYYIRVGGYEGDFGDFELLAIVVDVRVTEGPFQNPANGHWYYLTSFGSWSHHEQLAIGRGGHLVSINDAAENEWVRSTFSPAGGFDRSFVIGINDAAVEGTFEWSSGEPVTYTNWAAGEPNGGAFENYGQMVPNGTWNDVEDCPVIGDAVIEVESLMLPGILGGPVRNPANCHDYYITHQGTWIEAQLVAESIGGDLATVDDVDENTWLVDTFRFWTKTERPFWIGLTDRNVEGTFEWVDGTPVGFTNWNPGEPNNLGNEDYVAVNDFSINGWNDAHSGDFIPGVIEIAAPHCPCQCPLGDMNCDGAANVLDINPFVLALLDPVAYANQYPECDVNNADINGDGFENVLDINPFVALLLGGG
ncbi:Lectin C-type domain protein [Phycisphaerae bacterium RAS1]|nr:Lectin C-type domain protein [Phycisphaerae bacterium RAS1]